MVTILYLFGLHNVIFIGARIGVFVFITVFCCGCPCSEGDAEEYADPQNRITDPFADRLTSFEYEKYIIEDIRLQDRGSIREQIEQERQMAEMRRDQDFINVR